MLLLGITGPINHGKSSLAKALSDQFEGSSTYFSTFSVIAEVADHLNAATKSVPHPNDIDAVNQWIKPLVKILPQVVHRKVGVSEIKFDKKDVENSPSDFTKLFTYLNDINTRPQLIKTAINTSNKSNYRAILQWLGGYLVSRVSSDIWLDELMLRVGKLPKSGEQLAIIDGLRYPADADNVRSSDGLIIELSRPNFDLKDSNDATENKRYLIKADSIVYNTGSLDDLKKVAKKILADIQKGKLKAKYET